MSAPMRLALAVACGAALLAGIIVLGRTAREDLARQDHYSFAVDELDVPSPPGLDRAAFLDEVRYLSGLPAKLDRTAADTPERLRAAFATHPWVEAVEVGDLSTNQAVMLKLRTPALAVGHRVLDRWGVVLPMRTSSAGLPEYRGSGKVGRAPSGRPAEDAGLVAVAKIVGWLHSQFPAMHFTTVEPSPDGLLITRDDGAQILWGRNDPSEPSMDTKRDRLKAWTGGKIDLRK